MSAQKYVTYPVDFGLWNILSVLCDVGELISKSSVGSH